MTSLSMTDNVFHCMTSIIRIIDVNNTSFHCMTSIIRLIDVMTFVFRNRVGVSTTKVKRLTVANITGRTVLSSLWRRKSGKIVPENDHTWWRKSDASPWRHLFRWVGIVIFLEFFYEIFDVKMMTTEYDWFVTIWRSIVVILTSPWFQNGNVISFRRQ